MVQRTIQLSLAGIATRLRASRETAEQLQTPADYSRRVRFVPSGLVGRLILVGIVTLAASTSWTLGGVGLDRQASLAGVAIGVLVGLTGMGSGALMAPFLILVAGVPPVTAVGTDLAFAAITKAAGGIEHARQRTVDFRVAAFMAAGSVPAGLLSVLALEDLTRSAGGDETITRVLGGVLVLAAGALVAGLLVGRRRSNDRSTAPPVAQMDRPTLPRARLIILGAIVGVIVGLTSVGAGSIVVVVLSLATPLPAATIVGTDIVHAVALTATTGTAHGLSGNIDFGLLANLLAGSVPGVLLGSRLSVRVPATLLRAILALVLLATGVKLL